MKKKWIGNMPDKENHPLRHLAVASQKILEIHRASTGDDPIQPQSISVYVCHKETIKVTIDAGADIEAEYAILKASSENPQH